MRDVTGITGAAPTWISVMNYLHDRFGSGQVLRPTDVVLGEVSFPGAVEPPRNEWFLADTQPSASPNGLDNSNPQILAPAASTIIALDPDIPASEQRVAFEASRGATDARWILDGRMIAPVRGTLLWTPSPGAHTLSIARESAHPMETIEFTVRGGAKQNLAEDERAAEQQVQ
jgi:penicillin-binding protein 1C